MLKRENAQPKSLPKILNLKFSEQFCSTLNKLNVSPKSPGHDITQGQSWVIGKTLSYTISNPFVRYIKRCRLVKQITSASISFIKLDCVMKNC